MLGTRSTGVSQSTEQQKQTLQLIWWAFLGAVVPFWWVKNTAITGEPQPGMATFILILALLAVGECVGAWIWSAKTLDGFSKKIQPGQGTQMSPQDAEALSQRVVSMTIVFLAIFEAIAVYGMVAHFVGSPYPNTFETFLIFSPVNLVAYKIRSYPQILQTLDQLGNIRKGMTF